MKYCMPGTSLLIDYTPKKKKKIIECRQADIIVSKGIWDNKKKIAFTRVMHRAFPADGKIKTTCKEYCLSSCIHI